MSEEAVFNEIIRIAYDLDTLRSSGASVIAQYQKLQADVEKLSKEYASSSSFFGIDFKKASADMDAFVTQAIRAHSRIQNLKATAPMFRTVNGNAEGTGPADESGEKPWATYLAPEYLKHRQEVVERTLRLEQEKQERITRVITEGVRAQVAIEKDAAAAERIIAVELNKYRIAAEKEKQDNLTRIITEGVRARAAQQKEAALEDRIIATELHTYRKESERAAADAARRSAAEERDTAAELHKYRTKNARDNATTMALIDDTFRKRSVAAAKQASAERMRIIEDESKYTIAKMLRIGAASAGAFNQWNVAAGFYGAERVGNTVGIGSTSVGAAGAAGLGATAAAIAGVVGLLRAGKDLNVELARLNTLMSTADGNLTNMRDKALQLSAAFGEDLIETVRGFKLALSSGIDEKDLVRFSTNAMVLSKALTTSFSNSTDVLTSLKDAYGLSVGELAHVNDVLFNSVYLGKVNIDQLISGMGRIIPVARAAGISIEETMAAIATMTRGGQSASQAISNLSQLISAMEKPSKQAIKTAKEYGVELGATTLRTKGLYSALSDIRDATGGDFDILNKLFPELRAARGASQLSNMIALFKQMNDEIGKSGTAVEAAAKATDTFYHDASVMWDKLIGKVKAFGGSIADAMHYLTKGVTVEAQADVVVADKGDGAAYARDAAKERARRADLYTPVIDDLPAQLEQKTLMEEHNKLLNERVTLQKQIESAGLANVDVVTKELALVDAKIAANLRLVEIQRNADKALLSVNNNGLGGKVSAEEAALWARDAELLSTITEKRRELNELDEKRKNLSPQAGADTYAAYNNKIIAVGAELNALEEQRSQIIAKENALRDAAVNKNRQLYYDTAVQVQLLMDRITAGDPVKLAEQALEQARNTKLIATYMHSIDATRTNVLADKLLSPADRASILSSLDSISNKFKGIFALPAEERSAAASKYEIELNMLKKHITERDELIRKGSAAQQSQWKHELSEFESVMSKRTSIFQHFINEATSKTKELSEFINGISADTYSRGVSSGKIRTSQIVSDIREALDTARAQASKTPITAEDTLKQARKKYDSIDDSSTDRTRLDRIKNELDATFIEVAQKIKESISSYYTKQAEKELQDKGLDNPLNRISKDNPVLAEINRTLKVIAAKRPEAAQDIKLTHNATFSVEGLDIAELNNRIETVAAEWWAKQTRNKRNGGVAYFGTESGNPRTQDAQ